MSLLQTAIEYTKAGLSVIPCHKKRPTVDTWKKYQEKPLDETGIKRVFSAPSVDQIALICGKVSGGLEIIDIDLKNDPSGTLWDLLWNDLLSYFNNTMPLLVANTPSGGVHLYYRYIPESGTYEGNQKIARLERGKEAVIETRGEGGYAISYPSPGYTMGYGEIAHISTITELQRNDILDICRKYNKDVPEVRRKQSTVQASAYMHTPWDAYDNDSGDPWMKVLEDYGWTLSHTDPEGRTHFKRPGSDNPYGANWQPDLRIFYVWTPNGGFPEPVRGYRPSAIHAFLKCGGDFAESTKQLREAGYGQPFTDSQETFVGICQDLIDKGLAELDIMKRVAVSYMNDDPDMKELSKEERKKKADIDLPKLYKAGAERQASANGLFWIKNKRGHVTIALDGLILFLRTSGFRLFVQESESMLYRLVFVNEGTRIIEEVADDVIMKWVESWINANADNYEVSKSKLILALFSFKEWTHVLKFLNRVLLSEVSFLRDTKSSTYLPFKNCIIHITKDDIQPIPYSKLPSGMLVWKNQIKDTEIEIMGIQDGDDLALNECPVFRFLKRISGIMPDQESIPFSVLKNSHAPLFNRLLSHLSILGYLMSNYKDPGRPYAVILGEDTPTDKKGGGAGKDLIMKCTKKIRGVSFLPGKLWKPTANFAFQTYKMGDDILYIGDPPKFFDFELLYNSITEGLTIEKKNKDALVIPYELSPKIVISTNYSIDDISEHAARRQVKMLLTKYYSKTTRVEDELGGQFWSDEWTHRDWMLFYLLMFTCIQIFLDQGVLETEKTDNSKEKAVKIHYGDEFFSFIHDWVSDNEGVFIPYTDLYKLFLEEHELSTKEYSRKKFSYAIEFYAGTYEYSIEEKRIRHELGNKLNSLRFTKQEQIV